MVEAVLPTTSPATETATPTTAVPNPPNQRKKIVNVKISIDTDRCQHFYNSFRKKHPRILDLLLAFVGGAIGSGSAIFFQFTLRNVLHLIWDIIWEATVPAIHDEFGNVLGYSRSHSYGFLFGCFLCISLLISILSYFCDYIAFKTLILALKDGLPLKFLYAPQMFILSLLSISAGSSIGPEATVVIIGGCAVGFTSYFVKLNKKHSRVLTLSGSGGAATVFLQSPVSGGLFVLESPHPFGLEFPEAYIPVLVASCVSYIFFTLYGIEYGEIPGFEEEYSSVTILEVLQCILIGVVAGILSYIYYFFYLMTLKFANYIGTFKRSEVILPFVGGVFLVTLGCLFPLTLFWGERELSSILSYGEVPLSHWKGPTFFLGNNLGYNPYVLLASGFIKMITNTLSMHYGFKGGIIYPTFVSAACFVAFLGHFIPELNKTLWSTCLMSCMISATLKTPISMSMMVSFAVVPGGAKYFPLAVFSTLITIYMTTRLKFFPAQFLREDHGQHEHVLPKPVTEPGPTQVVPESTPQSDIPMLPISSTNPENVKSYTSVGTQTKKIKIKSTSSKAIDTPKPSDSVMDLSEKSTDALMGKKKKAIIQSS